MKLQFLLLVFCLCGIQKESVLGQVTIGSNASVPVLHNGNVNSLFTVVNDVITQDVIIDGDLQFLLSGITFNGSAISCVGGGVITFYLSDDLHFRSTTFEGGLELIVEDSYITYQGGEISNWFKLSLIGLSRIDASGGALLSDIFSVEILGESTLNGYEMIVDDAPILKRELGLL